MNVLGRIDAAPALDARYLVLAILAAPVEQLEKADEVLYGAYRAGVDPLDYCAATLGLGQHTVLERAAVWAGFAYSPTVPALVAGRSRISRIDALADVRTIRGWLRDREVTFYAPRFPQLLRLAEARLGNDALSQHLCFAPAQAIRAALAASVGDELLDGARHRLTRQWPLASAELDLPIETRVIFVVLFAALAAAVSIAPYFFSLALLPLVALLILLPALLRLLAIFEPPPRPPRVRLLNDRELPVYSVLIPLRDEAGMVPMLRKAMSAIDYPALCIKRTKGWN
jgi:hypothetical protein